MKNHATLLPLLSMALMCAAGPKETALDRYVRKPDPSYRYEVVRAAAAKDSTVITVDMTSQTWRKPAEIDRTEWRHWLTIIKPDRVDSDLALLLIGGGSMRPNPPNPNAALAEIARQTGAVVAELRMVPNEPVKFADESRTRTEDEIIAYTWDKFLRGGDEEWPLRLPMTKAAVRAMDTVTAILAKPEYGGVKTARFLVAGASKRGWTTWTTAAVDRRVIAIAPVVIDVVNVEKAMDNHHAAYGFFAPSVADYTSMKIFDWKGHPRFRELMKIEDPWEYRERYTMPKYVVNSTGDEYFPPDSSRFYFPALKGEKYLRYIPNSDHSLDGTDVYFSLAAFLDSLVHNRPRPRFDWRFEKDGSILLTCRDTPSAVKLWQATNPDARDFRLERIGKAWKSTELTPKNGVYLALVEKPAKGWTAFMVEVTFPGGGKIPMKFTTPVRIIPDVLPHRPPQAK
jgi:PhoPQ-activated pathogenicity-related protein